MQLSKKQLTYQYMSVMQQKLEGNNEYQMHIINELVKKVKELSNPDFY